MNTKTFEDLVKDSISPIGALNTDEMRRKIVESMSAILASRTVKHDIKASSAWEAMTDWEKCKWVIANRIIPSFGQEIRKQYDRACALNYQMEKAGYEQTGFYPYLPEPQLPNWALYDPDSVLVMDINMMMPRPEEKIVIDFTVPAAAQHDLRPQQP